MEILYKKKVIRDFLSLYIESSWMQLISHLLEYGIILFKKKYTISALSPEDIYKIVEDFKKEQHIFDNKKTNNNNNNNNKIMPTSNKNFSTNSNRKKSRTKSFSKNYSFTRSNSKNNNNSILNKTNSDKNIFNKMNNLNNKRPKTPNKNNDFKFKGNNKKIISDRSKS